MNEMNIEERQDRLFRELLDLLDEEILVVTESDQLNLFGQTFRPVFCGTITEVEHGHLTLFPITIKMVNAPYYQFPIPLSIPLEKITHFTADFNCENRFPLI
jgi:hypothetical protein